MQKNKKTIEDIIKLYNPTQDRCRPTVNPDLDNTQDRDNLEIACMIAGYKNIYFTRWPEETIQNANSELKPFIKNFDTIDYTQYHLSKPEEISGQIVMVRTWLEEQRALMYTPAGKKNAFLFYLHELEINIQEFESPGSWAESNNPYLIGILLEYTIQDIEFYYLAAAFKEFKGKSNPEFNKPFAKWDKSLQAECFEYKKTLWPQSENFQILQQDKTLSDNWLAEHNNISVQNLETLVQEKEIKLKTLIQNK